MAKISTLIAASAILAFSGSAVLAECVKHQSAQQSSVQTAEQPQQTTKPTTTKTEDAAQ